MRGFWASIGRMIASNPISTFAVLCVAALMGFLGYMMVWQTNILSSPSWCAKSMGAEKVAPGQDPTQVLEALKSCNNLLMVQLEAVATDSHINHTAGALAVLFLIIVVVAGARASFKASKSGIEGSISRDDAADEVAEAAVHKAEEIKEAPAP